MDLAAAGLMLIYFVYVLGVSVYSQNLNFDLYDPTFILKLLISGGGAGYLIYNNLEKLKSMFKTTTDKTQVDFKNNTQEKELMDYQSLVYLRKRAKELKSQELMDLVVKLNNILFSNVDKL